MFTKLENRKVWKREDGVRIWLPCDKRTFRIVGPNFEYLSPRRFRTLEGAVRAAERITVSV